MRRQFRLFGVVFVFWATESQWGFTACHLARHKAWLKSLEQPGYELLNIRSLGDPEP